MPYRDSPLLCSCGARLETAPPAARCAACLASDRVKRRRRAATIWAGMPFGAVILEQALALVRLGSPALHLAVLAASVAIAIIALARGVRVGSARALTYFGLALLWIAHGCTNLSFVVGLDGGPQNLVELADDALLFGIAALLNIERFAIWRRRLVPPLLRLLPRTRIRDAVAGQIVRVQGTIKLAGDLESDARDRAVELWIEDEGGTAHVSLGTALWGRLPRHTGATVTAYGVAGALRDEGPRRAIELQTDSADCPYVYVG
jgi:hypothetical protein